MSNVYVEPSRELTVEAECDILVVGGGAAAHYQDIAFGLNRQFTGRLHIYVAH